MVSLDDSALPMRSHALLQQQLQQQQQARIGPGGAKRPLCLPKCRTGSHPAGWVSWCSAA